MKTLVVEDDTDTRRLLERVLRRRRHEVAAFASAEAAWQECQQTAFPLVLLDQGLPGLDGREFCRAIRSLPWGSTSVILMITARDRADDVAAALEAGANDYLFKPFEIRLLDHRLAIAERQAAEAAVRAQAEADRRWLAAIVDSAEDPIIGMALDGRITSWNRGAERLYGYSAAEAIGQPIAMLVPPDRPEEAGRILARLRAGESVDHFETARRRQDGRLVDVSLRVSPIVDAQGQVLGAASIARDISERKRQQAALEQQAALLDLAHDAILVRDFAGTITFWNHGAEELYGWTRQEAIGQVVHDLLRTRLDQPLGEIEAVLRQTGRWIGELGHVTRDGREVLVASRWAVKIGPTDQDTAVLEINRDVTERRALERLKDELVAVVSHELRTPLAAILGFAELLRDREYGPAERRQYLGIIVQEGQRLTNLINDFLDLQRLESGRHQLDLAPCDPRTLIEQTIAVAGDDAQRPIRLDLPCDLPPVLADPDRILQVLTNLFSNARKYSPAGGEIVVTVRAQEAHVEVAIQDHGLGIPADALPRLFDKFQRIDTSDRRAIAGTGLGLAIVKNIIEAHGGRVWAESDGSGRGARFCFTLPIATPSLYQSDILIVEDDQNFARLLEAHLAGQGLSVCRAASGEEALERLPITRPRAVVLDLRLPGIQGETFLARLRDLGTQVPVLVVTVEDLTLDQRSGLYQLGVRAILRKGPEVASQVTTRLAELLNAVTSREIGR